MLSGLGIVFITMILPLAGIVIILLYARKQGAEMKRNSGTNTGENTVTNDNLKQEGE